jgi:2-oxo-3-hexenedioate decarboxylase
MDRGVAANVLGGPVHALSHLVRGLAEHPLPVGIEPGHLVTTGTVTRAFPVRAGETWRTKIGGLPVPELHIRFVSRP